MSRISRCCFCVAIFLFGAVSPRPVFGAGAGDVAIVVGPDTPVDDLSFSELRKLFLGDRQFWNTNHRVTLLIRAPVARERDVVLKTIYQMTEAQYRKYWISKVFRAEATTGPKIVFSNSMASELVLSLPGSVAFVDASQVPKGLESSRSTELCLATRGTRCGKGANGMTRKITAVAPLCAILIGMVPAVFAQQPASQESDDHQLVMQLLQRVNELEAEVKRLKGPEANAVVAGVTPQQTAPAPATSTAAPVTSATSANGMAMPGMTLPDIAGVQFRGFADAGFAASTQKGPPNSNTPGAHSTFSEGPFNLFMTSRMSDQFSALGELLFSFDSINNTHAIIQRAELHYTPNDYFNLTAGRFHTGIGYYNTAYHHASWLIPTVTRPFVFQFEDDGGILPEHMVGLGNRCDSIRAPRLHYIAEIGNGRPSASVVPSVLSRFISSNPIKPERLSTWALIPARRPSLDSRWDFPFTTIVSILLVCRGSRKPFGTAMSPGILPVSSSRAKSSRFATHWKEPMSFFTSPDSIPFFRRTSGAA